MNVASDMIPVAFHSKLRPPGTVTLGRPELVVGQKVIIADGRRGVLRFCGTTQFADGIWCGIELRDGLGKHDGEVQGVRYFTCAPLSGVFLAINKVRPCSESCVNDSQAVGETKSEVSHPVEDTHAQPSEGPLSDRMSAVNLSYTAELQGCLPQSPKASDTGIHSSVEVTLTQQAAHCRDYSSGCSPTLCNEPVSLSPSSRVGSSSATPSSQSTVVVAGVNVNPESLFTERSMGAHSETNGRQPELSSHGEDTRYCSVTARHQVGSLEEQLSPSGQPPAKISRCALNSTFDLPETPDVRAAGADCVVEAGAEPVLHSVQTSLPVELGNSAAGAPPFTNQESAAAALDSTFEIKGCDIADKVIATNAAYKASTPNMETLAPNTESSTPNMDECMMMESSMNSSERSMLAREAAAVVAELAAYSFDHTSTPYRGDNHVLDCSMDSVEHSILAREAAAVVAQLAALSYEMVNDGGHDPACLVLENSVLSSGEMQISSDCFSASQMNMSIDAVPCQGYEQDNHSNQDRTTPQSPTVSMQAAALESTFTLPTVAGPSQSLDVTQTLSHSVDSPHACVLESTFTKLNDTSYVVQPTSHSLQVTRDSEQLPLETTFTRPTGNCVDGVHDITTVSETTTAANTTFTSAHASPGNPTNQELATTCNASNITANTAEVEVNCVNNPDVPGQDQTVTKSERRKTIASAKLSTTDPKETRSQQLRRSIAVPANSQTMKPPPEKPPAPPPKVIQKMKPKSKWAEISKQLEESKSKPSPASKPVQSRLLPEGTKANSERRLSCSSDVSQSSSVTSSRCTDDRSSSSRKPIKRQSLVTPSNGSQHGAEFKKPRASLLPPPVTSTQPKLKNTAPGDCAPKALAKTTATPVAVDPSKIGKPLLASAPDLIVSNTPSSKSARIPTKSSSVIHRSDKSKASSELSKQFEQTQTQLSETTALCHGLKSELVKSCSCIEALGIIVQHQNSQIEFSSQRLACAWSKLDRVCATHSAELKALQENHEQSQDLLSRNHDEDKQSVILRLTEQHARDISRLKAAHANELATVKMALHAEREAELDNMRKEFSSLEGKLKAEVGSLTTECIKLKKLYQQAEAALHKDADAKLQVFLEPYKSLPHEITSLKAVIEMKSAETRELRSENNQLKCRLDEVPELQKRLDDLQLRNENLQALLDIVSQKEKDTAEKYHQLSRRAVKDSKEKQRLSLNCDALALKLEEQEFTNSLHVSTSEMDLSTLSLPPYTIESPGTSPSNFTRSFSRSSIKRKSQRGINNNDTPEATTPSPRSTLTRSASSASSSPPSKTPAKGQGLNLKGPPVTKSPLLSRSSTLPKSYRRSASSDDQ